MGLRKNAYGMLVSDHGQERMFDAARRTDTRGDVTFSADDRKAAGQERVSAMSGGSLENVTSVVGRAACVLGMVAGGVGSCVVGVGEAFRNAVRHHRSRP